MKFLLICVAGQTESMAWPLDESVSIGRDRTNTIALDDSSVSRRHCLVEPRDGGHMVRDLESSNGTYVNGLPVAERQLEAGDQIRVGRSVFRLAPLNDGDERALTSSIVGQNAHSAC